MKELSLALVERDEAIERVADNNEKLNEGWQELAFAFMRSFAMNNKSFFPWQVTEAFEKKGYVKPHDDRAWGQVYRRAAKENLISRGNEIGKHPRRHAVAVLNWCSRVYCSAAA